MQGTRQSTPSILADVSVASAREPTNSHLLRSVGGTVYQVHTAAAWLTPQGQALFALATNTGSILLVKLPLYGIQGKGPSPEYLGANEVKYFSLGGRG